VRVSELKGKVVITVPQGEKIGTVEDVFLRPEEQRLGALLVNSPSFAGPQVLLAADINSIGGDAVTTQSDKNLKDHAQFGESVRLVRFGEASGRKVATTSGNYAGELSDVHLDPATGRITGYEVTGGRFAKMFGRSHTIEASEQTHLGKDVLIVADDVIPAQLV